MEPNRKRRAGGRLPAKADSRIGCVVYGLTTSTRLMAPAGSSHIGEHRDSIGAHEVPSTQSAARDANGLGAIPRPPPHSCDRACRHGW
eukprot:4888861-Prymnesium_polylepis.1